MLREYLQKNTLITDGAMGTYYYQKNGEKSNMSEWDNINNPELIKTIHQEYIEAGARLIRTNTFAANTQTMDITKNKLEELIMTSYKLALSAVEHSKKQVFVAADIGPIPENKQKDEGAIFSEALTEYQFIIDCFLKAGASIFLFETLSSTENLKQISEYIKKRNKDAFVIAQFAFDATGHTRQGININRIARDIESIKEIDLFGLNCGIGPGHMSELVQKYEKIPWMTALPNAGYPYIENQRTIYPNNPDYFAERLLEIKNKGIKIIGGCCGTTPEHIRAIALKISKATELEAPLLHHSSTRKYDNDDTKGKQSRYDKLMNEDEKFIFVELDPPYGKDIMKIVNGAKTLKQVGVDAITIADSPLGKARASSTAVAVNIQRQAKIQTMPHISCRDNNIIGLKSRILGAYIEGVRSILCVTGDPVPSVDRGEIKGVFNLNSTKLIALLKEMNEEIFSEDPIAIGAALNLNVPKISGQMKRAEKKLIAGADFFLTQPIYSNSAIENLKVVKKNLDIKIVGGILPLVSYRNAQFLNNEVPGIQIPEQIYSRFKADMTREESQEVGIDISIDLIEKMIDDVDGLYFMAPFNRADMIAEIIRRRK